MANIFQKIPGLGRAYTREWLEVADDVYAERVASIRKGAFVAHRASVAAPDKLTDLAVGDLTLTNAGTGSLASNTAHYATAIAGVVRGVGKVASSINTVTTADDGDEEQAVTLAIPQVAGADFYDIFMSTDAAPKWLTRITEAQRLAGGRVLAVGGNTIGDTAAEAADKIRTAIGLESAITDFYAVSGSGAAVVLTADDPAANDATLNIALTNGTATGLTAAPTSANTTPGVAPTAQVETATIVGTITAAGDATFIVTAAGMTGSPKVIRVPVALADDASAVAEKARVVLAADTDVSAVFAVSGTGADIVLTKLVGGADDATANLAFANDSCTGLTPDATSTDTTPGVAVGAQIETVTIVGDVTGTGVAIFTITADGFNDDEDLVVGVPVVDLDTAAEVAGKARAVLAADADVTEFFTISGADADIIFTANVAAAEDATMNIAYDNGTCTGLTADSTSADTSPGAAGTAQVETMVIVGTVTQAGNVKVTVTAAGMTNSPKTILVPVEVDDTASDVAALIRAALDLDEDVAAFFDAAGGADANVVMTASAPAANDATMNFAYTTAGCEGLTPDATSTNTVAGAAGTAQVETATVVGDITLTGTVEVVVTSALLTSPVTVSVTVSGAGTSGEIVCTLVGTGLASDNVAFSVSNAYDLTGVTGIDCDGHAEAMVYVDYEVTAFSTTPAVVLAIFYQANGVWRFGELQTLAPLSAAGKSTAVALKLNTNQADGFAVLVESIAAGAAVSIGVELI